MKYDYTYGIELEFYYPENIGTYSVGREEIAKKITNAGIPSFAKNYDNQHKVCDFWKVTTDGSLNERTGAEIVSPVLRGKEGIEKLLKVLKVLNQLGCTVNSTCGMHLHVGLDSNINNLSLFKNLVRFYQEYEEVIDTFMLPSRRASNNNYINTLKHLNKRALFEATSINEIRRLMGFNRYLKLNIEPFWRQGTVEFRHHSGTLSATKIISWMNVCMSIVQKAETEELDKISKYKIYENSSQQYIGQKYTMQETAFKKFFELESTLSDGVSQEDINSVLRSSTWGSLNALLTKQRLNFTRKKVGRKYYYSLIKEDETFVLEKSLDEFSKFLDLDPLVISYLNERVSELGVG